MNPAYLLFGEIIILAIFIPFFTYMKTEQKRRMDERFRDIETRLARLEGKTGIDVK